MTKATSLLTAIQSIIKAAGKELEFSTSSHFALSIEIAPYEHLVIESCPTPDVLCGETRRISIHQYYDDGNTDLHIDMEITDNGYPISTQTNVASYRCCYWRRDTDKVIVVNSHERANQLSFARVLARSLSAQRFIDAAKKLRNAA